MTERFPDSPVFTGWEAPQRFEGDIYDLEIDGEIPPDLDGALFRVTPDRQYPPRFDNDIFFNGDGSVSSFRIKDGHVDFKVRYIRTPRYLSEHQARRSLFGMYRNPFTDDPSVAGLSRSTGNTNVVVHNGLLWALKEDSLPYAMDPETLETIGESNFAGQIRSRTFTAHPKWDPRTGDMYCFGYEARGLATPDLAYYVIDPAGVVRHEAWFRMPYPGMVHDMALTENHVIFPIMPFSSSLERMKAGGQHWVWEPDVDVYFGVIPRNGGGEDVRWFHAPNAFPGHTINAFEDKGKIYLDVLLVTGRTFFPWWPDAQGRTGDAMNGDVMRIEIDLRRRDLIAEPTVLTPIIADLPAVDDRYVSTSYRHAYLTTADPAALEMPVRAKPYNGYFTGFLHVDAHTGAVRGTWAPGALATVQEPVFVPRDSTAAEGEGYLMAVVNRHDEVRSELVVLDSTRIDAGPIATARLPFRMKNGIHGSWADATQFRPRMVEG
ncbi:carotenoid oxygenase family protein [Nocardia sp. CDC159]|uniref:Dioxygenase n=1 Tax=Nocardia pulmonis TaxID=2951408 RepID=A0A9X2EEI1_9NOCA|nr:MULTISPECIES: carotenoid oxygenase family protein [Nocardia]MCM6778926.1 carotenoid oxygenase family protein [Nocardia pulmonis]MCM6791821.1 carotenoid oxygenase family protein [Nocardia sp. CDC159]